MASGGILGQLLHTLLESFSTAATAPTACLHQAAVVKTAFNDDGSDSIAPVQAMDFALTDTVNAYGELQTGIEAHARGHAFAQGALQQSDELLQRLHELKYVLN